MSNFEFGRGRKLYSSKKKQKIDNDELLSDNELTCNNSPNLSSIKLDLHTETNDIDFDFDLIDEDDLILSSKQKFIPLITTPIIDINIGLEIIVFDEYLNGAKLLQGEIISVSNLTKLI